MVGFSSRGVSENIEFNITQKKRSSLHFLSVTKQDLGLISGRQVPLTTFSFTILKSIVNFFTITMMTLHNMDMIHLSKVNAHFSFRNAVEGNRKVSQCICKILRAHQW